MKIGVKLLLGLLMLALMIEVAGLIGIVGIDKIHDVFGCGVVYLK